MKDNFKSEQKRPKTLVAASVFLCKDGEVLLQKRQNTGFSDGMWDASASGHVENGETIKAAAIRELKEETGVVAKDLSFAGIVHEYSESAKLPYVLVFFRANKWVGEPQICEPKKCSELKWFNINNLPSNTIESRRMFLEKSQEPNLYLECGWEKKTHKE